MEHAMTTLRVRPGTGCGRRPLHSRVARCRLTSTGSIGRSSP